jgi:hypothetical protein
MNPSPPSPTRSSAWPWAAVWLAVGVATAALVRLPGPAVLDPDEYASALYFDHLIHGRRLEELLLSAPKPLLTLVHGLAWTTTHDWRVGTALTVAAFALAVTALARAAARLAGPAAAVAVGLAVAGSGALILQVARGNSSIWALAGWAVALDALARPKRRWGVAAAALLLAGLARAEGWLLLAPAALLGLVAWRRGERGGLLLLVPLAAPLLWLGHDLLLAGDPLYSLKVPDRYTDLVSGRQVIRPGTWVELVARRYAHTPVLAALALLGAVWLALRRSWLWLAGLGVLLVGVLGLLGAEAWRGTYVSFRYYDPADASVRVLAGLGAAWPLTAAAAWMARRRAQTAGGHAPGEHALGGRAQYPSGQAPGEHAPGEHAPGEHALGGRAPNPGGHAAGGGVVAAAGGAVAVAALVAAACWPLAPTDPGVGPTLDRAARSSRNTASAVAALRQVSESPRSVVVVSGPQRYRVALELGMPLERVRDLYLGALTEPLPEALSGAAAVYHDRGGDQPAGRFAELEVTGPERLGPLLVEPMVASPLRGLYVLRVEVAPRNVARSPSD